MPPDETQALSRIEMLLKHHRKGLTTSEITRSLKGNRNSTAKYLAILQTSGIVEKNQIGASYVYTLSRKVTPQNLLNYISEMILVLDGGQIIESGRHGELMEKQGFYYNLYMSQFKKQEEVMEAGAVAK